MNSQPKLAEIRFVSEGISIYGQVSSLDASVVRIVPQTLPAKPEVLRPGTRAELALVGRGAIFMATAKVGGFTEGALTLLLDKSIRRVQRRGAIRKPCRLAVAYRAIRDNGAIGIWRDGLTSDLSVGGMCLLVAPDSTIPDRVALSFLLPDSEAPVKATARVIHSRPYAETMVAIGLCFTVVSPLDRLRIHQFTQGDTHEFGIIPYDCGCQ